MPIATNRRMANLETYKALLMQERAALVKRIYERRGQVLAQHDVDDEGAFATQHELKDFAFLNMEREMRTLTEVELSLRLLDSGQYGWCGSCGCEIPVARLRALPWTRTCITCAGGAVDRGKWQVHEAARTDGPQPHD